MLLDQLLEGRKPFDEVPVIQTQGVYAIFVKTNDCIPNIHVPGHNLIYAGQSSNLSTRNHFLADSSGFSSPRRSLGAILKAPLRLRARPRAFGKSKTNYDRYAFEDEDEIRLTSWMKQYLEYSVAAVDGDLTAIERKLVETLEPPLNLTLWRNPQKKQIQQLRNVCKEEARGLWLRRQDPATQDV